MKTKSKALLLALCAVLLVAASVLGTMAYLTSQAEVTNTFTVGSVSITLDEAPVDENGEATTGTRVTENSYKLMPGHKYDKDPTIHVAANSEDCWSLTGYGCLLPRQKSLLNGLRAHLSAIALLNRFTKLFPVKWRILSSSACPAVESQQSVVLCLSALAVNL